MSTTLKALEAQSKVVEVRGDIAVVAATLDALAAYKQAATACATAMNAQGGMPDAVMAALSSASVAAAACTVITYGGGEDSRLERQLLEAALTACERSESLCAAHADHHDHCRLHAAVARETIEACQSLLTQLA
ncbi:MAG TPA: hypothetical protein VIJ20_07765 [Solirubrobacteraceae bacterium]